MWSANAVWKYVYIHTYTGQYFCIKNLDTIPCTGWHFFVELESAWWYCPRLSSVPDKAFLVEQMSNKICHIVHLRCWKKYIFKLVCYGSILTWQTFKVLKLINNKYTQLMTNVNCFIGFQKSEHFKIKFIQKQIEYQSMHKLVKNDKLNSYVLIEKYFFLTPSLCLTDNSVHVNECSSFWQGIFII